MNFFIALPWPKHLICWLKSGYNSLIMRAPIVDIIDLTYTLNCGTAQGYIHGSCISVKAVIFITNTLEVQKSRWQFRFNELYRFLKGLMPWNLGRLPLDWVGKTSHLMNKLVPKPSLFLLKEDHVSLANCRLCSEGIGRLASISAVLCLLRARGVNAGLKSWGDSWWGSRSLWELSPGVVSILRSLTGTPCFFLCNFSWLSPCNFRLVLVLPIVDALSLWPTKSLTVTDMKQSD